MAADLIVNLIYDVRYSMTFLWQSIHHLFYKQVNAIGWLMFSFIGICFCLQFISFPSDVLSHFNSFINSCKILMYANVLPDQTWWALTNKHINPLIKCSVCFQGFYSILWHKTIEKKTSDREKQEKCFSSCHDRSAKNQN